MNKKAIGIDLGRSPVKGIVADTDGNIIRSREINVPLDAPYDHSVEEIKKLINKLIDTDVIGICLGTPGWLDSARGICRYSPNYPLWKDVDIITPVKNAFNLPVMMLNDVNAAALGEKHFGAAKASFSSSGGSIFLEGPALPILSQDQEAVRREELSSLVFIAVGVGIGSGIIFHNQLVTGANEGAGEIGHITLEPEGPRCSCGSHGCFEALCSLIAIRRGVGEGLQHGWSSSISKHIRTPEDITFRVLKKCADEKDELTLKVLSIAGRYLGIGISMIGNLLDPELIVVGGEIIEILDLLHPYIMNELKKRVRMIPYQKVKFTKSKLGELSGACGAAALVFKRLYFL